MGILDVLGDIGTVVSPGLETYGQGRTNVETLKASIRNNLLQRILETGKQREQVRQFGITSGLQQSQLAELMRHQLATEETARKKAEKIDPMTLLLMESRPDLFRPKELPITDTKAKGPGLLDRIFGRSSEASPGTSALEGIPPPEEYALKAIEQEAPTEVIIQGLKKNYNLSDAQINSYLQERLAPPTAPGPEAGQVGYGPLTQGNPQGGLASLSGSPIDFQQYLPRKEEILPRLRQSGSRFLGSLY